MNTTLTSSVSPTLRLRAMRVAAAVVVVAALTVVEAAYPVPTLDSSAALQVRTRTWHDR